MINLNLSTSQLAEGIRSGEITSLALTKACLARITTINPPLNAVVQVDREQALARAAAADEALSRGESWGPLHGVPFTIKDSFDTEGIISTWGTLGRASFVPKEDATVVKRLKAAGGILLGKTNTPEFTLSFETDNPIYGPTFNAHDPSRMPGGSSGGAVTAVTTAAVPFDIGSDTGGSIRLPSHFSGVAGIKPTTGRVPRTGHCPGPGGLVNELTQIGPIARTTADLALLLPLIAGPDGRDPYIVPVPLPNPQEVDLPSLRGAWYVDNGIVPAEEEVAQVVLDVVEGLKSTLFSLHEEIPRGIEQTLDLIGPLMRGWDGGAWVRRLLKRCGTAESDSSLTRYLAAPGFSPADTEALFDRLDHFRINMLKFWQQYDFIICPPQAFPALKNGSLSQNYRGTSYTMSFNLTGWPAGVVRAGTSADGLPIGVQVVAPPWREDIVLAVMQQIENIFGGWQPVSSI
ncbi:MAG: amidase [Ardenticatenaceae bacterium]|nr:amidase [Ardenticatenaceae bacterium]